MKSVAGRFNMVRCAGGPRCRSGAFVVDKIDFLAFYQQLGLKPGCTLAELKVAYRRRVAALHPDRRGDAPADPAEAESLQALIATYNAANAFQRRYGRLPGGQHVAVSRPMPSASRPPPGSQAPAAPRRGLRRPLLWLAALGGIAWLVWSQGFADFDSVPARVATTPAAPRPTAGATAAMPTHLDIGMDADAVRALEGRPTLENPMHWDYGPSWVEFSDSKVTAWYSSRLRPLKVATTRQPAPDAAKPR